MGIDADDDVAAGRAHRGGQFDELQPVTEIVLNVEDAFVVEVKRFSLAAEQVEEPCL